MPEHLLKLDPRNPGQFFACCGLFELSELVAPGGEAWFADDGGEFVISTDARVPPQQLELESRTDHNAKPDDPGLEPLVLKTGERSLGLNWWLNETLTDKSPLKTWGGQQTPRRILDELLPALDFALPLENLPQSSAYTTSRFGVDPRSAWDAIDIGYSPNDESRKADKQARTFTWVEVLAVAGLQGFRPAEESRSRYRYAVWLTALTLSTARAACAAPWPGLPSRSFRFGISVRGQGYKTFSFAEGANNV